MEHAARARAEGLRPPQEGQRTQGERDGAEFPGKKELQSAANSKLQVQCHGDGGGVAAVAAAAGIGAVGGLGGLNNGGGGGGSGKTKIRYVFVFDKVG